MTHNGLPPVLTLFDCDQEWDWHLVAPYPDDPGSALYALTEAWRPDDAP